MSMKGDLEEGLSGLSHTSSSNPPTICEQDFDLKKALYYHWDELKPGMHQIGRWMYIGTNNAFLRRFNYIGVRCLYYKALELQQLEVKLHQLDADDENNNPDILQSGPAYNESRRELMEKLCEAQKSYLELLTLKDKADNIPAPARKNLENLAAFLNKHQKDLDQNASLYHDQEDLALLGGAREYTWMDETIEELAHRCPIPIVRKLLGARENGDEGESQLSQTRINILSKAILITLVGVLLSAPLYPLFSWTQGERVDGKHMAMIMALQTFCTAIFGVVLHLCTTAKRHEIFTASVAYMAILVVFMGQVRQG